MNGKGDRYRKVDIDKWDSNYRRIFGMNRDERFKWVQDEIKFLKAYRDGDEQIDNYIEVLSEYIELLTKGGV